MDLKSEPHESVLYFAISYLQWVIIDFLPKYIQKVTLCPQNIFWDKKINCSNEGHNDNFLY